ncbi:amidohydrolase family protein [Flavobacterium subsaxonicum]|uniref:Amidohydrolase n=1 Tax=Flavobacterium subsaxonicum WB 4.1-42 = DSM 21790 TaxID=1121898 RepID=A0A0A2MRI6_9FLAO|nr:amidohydrolase family protein [Flavobacterium subsaxonicum]KGO94964.1 amidohydrolase [Flavobacterium subsaxonicum WB 4.1-42 = DSM 21790]
MQKIDSHQHFWKFDPVRDAWIGDAMHKIRRDFLPEDLFPLLKQSGIAGCVAVQADQSEVETNFLLGLAEKNSFIKGVVGWIGLTDNNIAERLEYFSSYKKLKGFRHIVEGEAPGFMLRPDFVNGISALKPYNYTYDILVRPHQLQDAIALVNQFPNQPFVLDHSAKPDLKTGDIATWKAQIKELAKADNVLCKVSGLVTEAHWDDWSAHDLKPCLDTVFECFTPKRILFGSDWPVCNLAANYATVVRTLEDYTAQLSETEREQVWHKNAQTFYNLDS